MGNTCERQIKPVRNILAALTKTHGRSLDDERLKILMTEVGAVINLRPLTVETVSDSNSLIPVSPSNIQKMETSALMPPPGTFQ